LFFFFFRHAWVSQILKTHQTSLKNGHFRSFFKHFHPKIAQETRKFG
jgi:hypothetical protein